MFAPIFGFLDVLSKDTLLTSAAGIGVSTAAISLVAAHKLRATANQKLKEAENQLATAAVANKTATKKLEEAETQIRTANTANETAARKLEEANRQMETAEKRLLEAKTLSATADIRLKEAETNVQTAEYRRQEAEANRARAEHQLQQAQNKPTIEQARKLFDLADCIGTEICVELLCLPLFTTCKDATDGLETLGRNIDTIAANRHHAPIRWIQSALARFADDATRLTPAQDQPKVYTAIVMCYQKLVNYLDAQGETDAIGHCIRFMKRRTPLRHDTAMFFLPTLMNKCPTRQELQTEYSKNLDWRGAQAPQEQDLVQTLIYGLERCANLAPDDLAKLLDIAFHTAVEDWRHYGNAWRHVATQMLAKSLNDPRHRHELAVRIAGRIAFDDHMLDDENRDQYEAFASLLAVISDRDKRPRNRHVVPKEDVSVRLEIPGFAPIEARLVNFSTDSGRWTPGAFVRATKPTPVPSVNGWRAAEVTLTRDHLSIHIPNAEVRDPEAERSGTVGFRVRFTNASTETIKSLNELATHYPITR